jgi:hypothetical protein
MWLNVRDSDDSSEEATMPTRKQNPSTLTLIMTCSADEIVPLTIALKKSKTKPRMNKQDTYLRT